MSEFKRFVSYIYEYEQGEKRENVGFVKVNARGEECKIWIHVKGFYVKGEKPYQVSVFLGSRERLQKRFLGELENRNGALEWNCVTQTDRLMETQVSLEESKGFLIEGEHRVFAAEWDDYSVPVEQLVRMEEPEIAVEIQEESLEAAEAEEMTESTSAFDPRQEQWEYLTGRFSVEQFQDGEKAVSSIRLEQKDLNRIPRNQWGLGNNSFLLHGFYQYHHILLLRQQDQEEVAYLIGVPGVYNEREQLMASMFGFQEFKVTKRPNVKNSSFGYWCRKLE